jgi:hypothetical protein
MYRILQSLEREPSAAKASVVPQFQAEDKDMEDAKAKKVNVLSSIDSRDGENESSKALLKRTNPRKYLLYRPTFAQLHLYLSTSFKDIGENSAMLLYLSADGSKRAVKSDSTVLG